MFKMDCKEGDWVIYDFEEGKFYLVQLITEIGSNDDGITPGLEEGRFLAQFKWGLGDLEARLAHPLDDLEEGADRVGFAALYRLEKKGEKK